jgi:hypothetical protein
MVEGVLQSSPEGTPQGGPLSPLLANILLDDLDKALERRGLLFVRYADDFMIFTKTRRAAERVFFALAKQMRLFENLDQWTRRRLRMYFWKRWRFVRTRAQNLLALGVPRRQAFRHAKSRKGPWHMAKTIASGAGMTNAWVHDQGLVSLKSLWGKRAPLRRTA